MPSCPTQPTRNDTICNVLDVYLAGYVELVNDPSHLFWVESSQAWVELEHTQSGDYLLTPNGTIQVANVITHPQTETLVWELDTAGPDTFTVHTGTHDLLVHNNDDECGPNLSDRNPLYDVPGGRQIREAYEDIRLGNGSPRLNPDGSLDIFQGRGRAGSQWQGAQIFDVPGARTARILQRFDGNGQMILGYVTDHDYNVVRTFPSPWYPDGG